MLNPELLKILACPKCKNEIRLDQEKNGIICDNCNLIYEIREEIPIMLVDEAKKYSPEKKKK
jgi:uncharacterized protein